MANVKKILKLVIWGTFLVLVTVFYVIGIPVYIFLAGRLYQYFKDKNVKLVESARMEVRGSDLSTDDVEETGGVTVV